MFKLKKSFFWLPSIAIGITLGFSLQFVRAWVEPTTGAPNANIGAPLTTGGATQNKAGQLNVTGGGAYGSGGLGFGYHSLNSNSNGWLYMGDQWGNVYGGRGLAAESLWASGTSYASAFSDANNGNYYLDPNGTSRLNYGVFDNLYSYSWEATPINYDSNDWNYYSDPNSTSRMNYGVFNNLYSYGWMQATWFPDANDNNYYVDPNGTSRMNYGVYNNLYSYGWLQAQNFLDANDNNYYVDPNGTSRLNNLNVTGKTSISASGKTFDFVTIGNGGGYIANEGIASTSCAGYSGYGKYSNGTIYARSTGWGCDTGWINGLTTICGSARVSVTLSGVLINVPDRGCSASAGW